MDPAIISVTCVDNFDPKLIRIVARAPGGIVYSFDIPEPLYAMFADPLGLPGDPCKN